MSINDHIETRNSLSQKYDIYSEREEGITMFELETEEDIQIPNWDVALEALILEEYSKLGHALKIDDFHGLSVEYAIRFDDIMETVFALTLEGKWSYRDAQGQDKEITQDMIDQLYVNARLHEDDVREYTGGWSPVG